MQRPKLPEPELAITHWMSDGKMVKVVCLDCHRSDFHTLVGFINHCRRAHSREFPSREAAIEASGEEVYMDTSRDPRSNGSGRPWRSDMELTYRMSDGKMIKLVCLDCRRSNFYNAEGFINHCDIAHSRQFLSLKAAIEAYGEEVDMDMEGDPGESSVTSVAASQPSWGCKSSPSLYSRASMFPTAC